MTIEVPQHHPIREHFDVMVTDTFRHFYGLVAQQLPNMKGEPLRQMGNYVSNILIEFIHLDRINKINQFTKTKTDENDTLPAATLESLLYESEISILEGTPEREREVHQHIGDFTLFFAGMLPRYLHPIKTDDLTENPDPIHQHKLVGIRSYGITAKFENSVGGPRAALFTNLAQCFEFNVLCLSVIKQNLAESIAPDYEEADKTFLIEPVTRL